MTTSYSVLGTQYLVSSTQLQASNRIFVAARPLIPSLCFLGFLLFSSIVSAQDQQSRPNILLLVADDQRPDTIGILGNQHIKTPNLDDLVRRGTAFTRASCAHPLCYPSRAEILTGCTGFRNGTYSEQRLDPSVPLMPRTFRDAGYRTCYVGKWHTAGRPSKVGYEECDGLYASGQRSNQPYVDFRGRPATGYGGWQFQTDEGQRFPEKGIGLTPNISGDFADAAIRLIKKESTKPFFIHVNFTAPHDPRIWPTGYERLYDPARLPFPKNFVGEHPFDHGNSRGRDELLLPFPRTEADVRQERACYYAMISHMDAQIGRIFDALVEMRQRDNTIIIFTADHGLAIGSHGLVGKQNMYEHTIGVPLVIFAPGVHDTTIRQSRNRIRFGLQCNAQCYLRDLFPTLCEFVGIPVPDVDGKSLLPLLSGEMFEIYPYTIGYFQNSQRMICEKLSKLIWYPQINRWQLFHLGSDPDEMRDLIADPKQESHIIDLRTKLVTWLKRNGDLVAWQKQIP